MNNFTSTESTKLKLQMAFDVNSEKRFRVIAPFGLYGTVSSSARKNGVIKMSFYDVCRASENRTVRKKMI